MAARNLDPRTVVRALVAACVALAAGLAALVLAPRSGLVRDPGAEFAADASAPAVCTPRTPCLALVIDDIGRDPAVLRRLLATGATLTYSVLPHAKHTAKSLKFIDKTDSEAILHLPMAPLDPGHVTDERVVIDRPSDAARATRACLDRVPGVVGVNNHMGSAATARAPVVRAVLAEVRRRGLWFLDSRTTGGSVVCREAAAAGVRCLARDIFLDDPPGVATVDSRLREAEALAARRGWAVAIGHPHRSTVRSLERWLAGPHPRLVTVSTVLRRVPRGPPGGA